MAIRSKVFTFYVKLRESFYVLRKIFLAAVFCAPAAASAARLVEDQVVVELKSVEQMAPVHKKQLLTYLKLAKKPVGLLINFGAATLKEGIIRTINAPEVSLRQ